MAIILAAKAGSFTATDTWIGGVVPGAGDVAVANNFVVTVNASVTCAEVRNDTTGGATAGGSFALSNGVTLRANVFAGGTTVAAGCVGLASGSATIVGNVTAGSACHGARNAGTGTLTISGIVTGNDYGPGSTGQTANIFGAVNASSGALLVYKTVMGVAGMPAISGLFQYINPRAAQAKVRATDSLTEVALQDVVGWTPDPSDVKAGVVYEGRTGIWTPSQQIRRMSGGMA